MHPAIAAKHDEVTLRVSRVVDAMSVKYFGGAISQQPTHAHGDASIAPSAVPSAAPRAARRTARSATVPLRELSATQTAAWLANRGHTSASTVHYSVIPTPCLIASPTKQHSKIAVR